MFPILRSRNAEPPAEDDGDRITAIFRDGTAIERAIVASFAETIRRHRMTRTPLAIWKDGRVVMMDPDEVPIPDVDAVPKGA